MYLEFDDYKKLGGNLPEAAFKRFAFRASQLIDKETLKRLVGFDLESDALVKEAVTRCMFELIEFQSKNDILDKNKAVKSGSNDGVSVTYAEVELGKESLNIINTYLSNVIVNGVPVLYLGIR